MRWTPPVVTQQALRSQRHCRGRTAPQPFARVRNIPIMASPSVTVYTTGPACVRCTTTKNHLDKRGIPFTEVRIDEDPAIAESLRDKGFSTAPVVHYEVPDADGPGAEVWFDGYRPDSLDAIAGL